MKKADSDRMAQIKESGCICTVLLHRKSVPPDVHHLTAGGRRLGHQATIGLSPWLHRGIQSGGMSTQEMMGMFGPSLAHGKREFERFWGSEAGLLDIQNVILGHFEKSPWIDYRIPYVVASEAQDLWQRTKYGVIV